MTRIIRSLVPMLALVACAVEPPDPGERSTQDEEVQALGDPNICAPGPWTICNGLTIGEFCGSPLRCFAWNELPDGTYMCSCSFEPMGLTSTPIK